MIPKEILQQVKRIEINTRGMVNDLFGGEYHSVFKGHGMTFSEVREYQPGDDIRLIDWNVTARSGSPFIKIFEEERELTVYLMIDISQSGHFGTNKKLKKEIGAELASVLGFSAIKNQDKVGAILFTDDVELYIPPKKGKSHVLRVVRELLYYQPTRNKTSIDNALNFLLKVAKRRSVVFLISDFIDDQYWSRLKMANKKHDMIGLQLIDPAELNFPNIGLTKIRDPETGESFWIDTSSEKNRQAYTNEFQVKTDQLIERSKKIKFDLIPIMIDQDYIEPLSTYFRRRERRY